MKKVTKQRGLALFLAFALLAGSSLPGASVNAQELKETENVEQVTEETATESLYSNPSTEVEPENEAGGENTVKTAEETTPETKETVEPNEEEGQGESEPEEEPVSIEYRAHVQTYGWQNPVMDGETAGTSGKAKRVEAIQIALKNLPEKYAGSGIEYNVHVQSYGWQDKVKDGASAGTTGKGKRLEAITINLTGPIAEDYSVYYTTHVQTYGWLGWACDGQKAGSAAYAKRMEAIQVKLVKKGETPPTNENECYKYPKVKYRAHVQSYGWRPDAYDGADGGVTGKSKRLEALQISLPEQEYSGGITYRAHVQGIGWQDWVSDGQLAGTNGQKRRIEAIEIKLTGEMEAHYDVYYSIHMAKIGWTNYAKNGETAGSANLSKRVEAVRIMLVKKEGGTAPDTSGVKFIQGYQNSDLYYTGVPMGESVSGNIEQGGTVGVTGQSKALTGITLYLNQDETNAAIPKGTIEYATHLSSVGWTDWSTTGNFSGSADGTQGMEAVKIQLSGDISKYYDIYYRAHVQKYGWMGWAKNGQPAGTAKIGYRLEGLQIRLVSKDLGAPGSTNRYYTETKQNVGPNPAMTARANMYSSSTPYLIMLDRSQHYVGVYQGSQGLWSNIKYFPCSVGAPSTPTVTGVFRVGSKGYYFDSGDLRCYYFTQFYGDYLFHSVLYDRKNGGIADSRLGMNISHGCVRLEINNAKWIYDNIPAGSTVVVYN